MDNYYLKINVVHKNNKRYFSTCQLYNKNKLIKTYDRDITKEIYKLAKENHIDIVNKNNTYIIDNTDFISEYIGIPSKKISHVNTYAGMIATITSLTLSALGISALDHKYNPDLYNETSISTEVNDDELIDNSMIVYDTGSDEEVETTEIKNLEIDDSNIDLVYNKVEDTNKPHIIFLGDNEKLDDTTNEIITLSTPENIDDSCLYKFEEIDNSNDKYSKLIDLVYGDDVKALSEKYGFSYDFILADASRENGKFVTRNSTVGGVGPLQVEWYIWDGFTITDIDGTNYTFDCAKLNNISNDFGKMFEVSIYKRIFEKQNLSREELEENINTILELLKTDYDYDKYNNLSYELNNFVSLIDNASSFDEAKEQSLNCLNISNDNIIQYDNAIEGFKAGEIILYDNLNHIKNNNDNNVYNYKLTNTEVAIFTIWAQNKGQSCVDNCLKVTFNREDTEAAIKRTPYGDNEYLPHVFSYTKDGTVIQIRLDDENIATIKPQNLTLSNSITK